MTVNYTTLLGLAKPVSGTESGTWGDTVNTNLTDYLDSAVAGAQIISGTQTAVTLSKTTGASLSQAGLSNITGSSQYQIIRCTGNPASLLTITAPYADKTYVIINATSTSQSVKIVGVGPTSPGVTIASGKTSLVAWNGSDFVEITPATATTATTATNLASGSAGTIPYQSASGTTAMLAAGTSGQVLTSAGAAAPTWSTPAAATKTISDKTAAYTVVAGDLGKIINCTSGTFTVSLTAAASLGSGFTCTIWNTSTTASEVITIDPSGAETIDGRTSLVLRRGEGLAIVCNGTNWQTDDKKPMRVYAENINESSSEARPVASADGTVAIGIGTVASGGGAIAVGYSANATSNVSTSIGANSGFNGSVTATGSGAMALGGSYASGTDSFAAAITNNTSSYGAQATGSIAMGTYAKSLGNYCVAIGKNANATGASSIALSTGDVSFGANATGNVSIAVGQATASGGSAMALGNSTTASANYTTAIGVNSGGTGSQAVTGAGAMALGGSYASGVDSFAAAIANNTSSYGATGANSVAIGYLSKASGAASICIGDGSVASSQNSVSLGGSNTSSGQYAVAIGTSNNSIGSYSTTFGTRSVAAEIGKIAYSSGRFSVFNGSAQGGKIIIRSETTTTTAVVLTSDAGAASTTNQLIVASGQAMAIQGTLIAKQSGSGNMAGWNITGIVSNNGGTMAVSGLALTAIGSDSITLGAQPTIAVDNTNKGVTITSGYKSATSIRWVATVNTSEVTYA